MNSAPPRRLDSRVVWISLLCVAIAVFATFAGRLLLLAIAFFTQLFFFGRLSLEPSSPAGHHLGPWVVFIPVLGGLLVGLMARYGTKAIRGHGIPEAMDHILTKESRIPYRVTFWKPVSSAVAIGSGGPFGAEGPIIATGGAMGSALGQILHTSPQERKVLLSAGAAAGMTAVFGSPLSAVLLAIELLLFEFRPRSLIPVSLACATAAGLRVRLAGAAPIFPVAALKPSTAAALAFYVLLGGFVGLVSVGVTRAVYAVEDAFEGLFGKRLGVHWALWPAIGAIAVGLIGYWSPRTLGVGYENIEDILSLGLAGRLLAVFVIAKFVSWAVALGSGTSGGTLAPLFSVGGGIGALVGAAAAAAFPALGVQPALAGLVGMAAIFAGASRAFLASTVFVFEVTRDSNSIVPLLGACAAAFLVSHLGMENTIMTEKIARRGVEVPTEWGALEKEFEPG